METRSVVIVAGAVVAGALLATFAPHLTAHQGPAYRREKARHFVLHDTPRFMAMRAAAGGAWGLGCGVLLARRQ